MSHKMNADFARRACLTLSALLYPLERKKKHGKNGKGKRKRMNPERGERGKRKKMFGHRWVLRCHNQK
jgi:hypothetical protein